MANAAMREFGFGTGVFTFGRGALAAAGVLLALAGNAAAQGDLFSNGSNVPGDIGLATGTMSVSGVAAPGGFAWSEAPSFGTVEANAVLGFAGRMTSDNAGFRFADDFDVSASVFAWSVSEIKFYVYQPGAASAAAFGAANLRIWTGLPEAPGSNLVFGDTTTARPITVTATTIYRVASTVAILNTPAPSAPDTTRRVYEVTVQLSPPVTLRTGHYWLDWQISPSALDADVFAPPVTALGQRARAAGSTPNALQMKIAVSPTVALAWVPLIDEGKPGSAPDVAQDLPFILRGTTVALPCSPADMADDAGNPLPSPGPNNGVNEGDYNAFFNTFFVNQAVGSPADIADDAGVALPPFDAGGMGGNSNSGVNEGDYNCFFNYFFLGCG
ncbi:hypothetical protein BH11PLA1_BH11PLA1_23490 [soil metagenome]